MTETIDILRAQRDFYRTAAMRLSTLAKHDSSCVENKECFCGLSATMDALEEALRHGV